MIVTTTPSDHAVDRTEEAGGGRTWHFHSPGKDAAASWDPQPLTYACEMIARDRRKRMRRIHLVIAYPRIPGGVDEVVAYAKALAGDYELRVQCAPRGGMITVTFERSLDPR